MINNLVHRFIQYIIESENIVFFGGAGVSTESGIPDFRSKDGLYNQNDVRFDKYEPEYLLSRECLAYEPKVFFEFYRQKLDARNIQPNIAHEVLAKMESIGKLSAVVTQNIDGLHQKAGSKNVYEIHGTTNMNYCVKCGETYSGDFIFDSEESIPKCKKCGKIVRPDVVLYGENLPTDIVNGAINAIESADMLIIGGTSLSVYPANTYIKHFRGKHIVVINMEPLNVTLGKDDIAICGRIGEVFEEINEKLFEDGGIYSEKKD